MKVLDVVNNFKEVGKEFKSGNSHYWITLHVDEMYHIENYIALDEDSIEECRSSSQSSKISFFDGYIFLVFNALDYCDEVVTSKELNVFLSKDYIITVYKDSIDILEDLLKDIRESKNCFVLKDKPKVCILLYYILDRIVVRNYDVISSLEAQADKIEINILKNPKHEQIDNLISLRRQVYKIRKYLNPLRYIGDSLVSNDNSIIERDALNLFMSLNKKIDKLMMALESLVQDLALVREAFESEIANKTNELMKIFTIIATIFLPLNLLTGLHGMNLKGMPFENCNNGFYFILSIMISISLLLIYFFKRKKWL